MLTWIPGGSLSAGWRANIGTTTTKIILYALIQKFGAEYITTAQTRLQF